MDETSLQFYPFSSVISPSFWESFTNLKLHKLKLNTDPISISGVYSRRIVEGVPSSFDIHCDDAPISPQPGEIVTKGILISTNTIEDFKKKEKSDLIEEGASRVWEAIVSGEAETDASILSFFLIFIYGDLKKYHYYYWCAFPTVLHPKSVKLLTSIQTLDRRLKGQEGLVSNIHLSTQETDVDLSFFTVLIQGEGVQILPLSMYHSKLKEHSCDCEVWLGFSDPSNSPANPGWVLRNLLTLAAVRWADVRRHTIFALRDKLIAQRSSISQSLVFDVELCDEHLRVAELPASLGWERNERGKMGPRFCNMMKLMDPTRVAESAVGLNLSLMKWRLDPDLDLNGIKNCKCLLFGAGTLGCNVARCLLGWGVRKITFIDGGKVSYSNPVRQSLYFFNDCQGGDVMKAEAAANSLRNIYPRVESQGVCLSVPMPGHNVGPSQCQEVAEDVKTLENLVDAHDALFLLTDSRESRWLPTLLGTAQKKIVLTSALGFDSFLVMRHGSYPLRDGEDLGCYFCNDVVAPGDSVSDRSLDQQCTVTRPGVSFMASGQIVEMLVDILQYPQRLKRNEEEALIPPHSIRYYLGRLNQLITTTPAFKNCSACSDLVVSKYQKDGVEFLMNVFNSPSYLEELCGLHELHKESQLVDLQEFSDTSTADSD